MRTFLLDIFPRIQSFSESLDNITLLTNQHWVLIDDTGSNKTVYIFKKNQELIIVTNGIGTKTKWEYIDNKSILIDSVNSSSECVLFKHGFIDNNILALKVDNNKEYAIFVNENNFDVELNSLDRINDFLTQKYLDNSKLSMSQPTMSLLDQSNLVTVTRETNNNQILKIISEGNNTIGAKVYIGTQLAPNDIYIYKKLTHKIVVENGKIIRRYFLEIVGEYIFEKSQNSTPIIGDRIYTLNWEKVKDGKYRYSLLFKFFNTKDGIIIE